MKREDWRHRWLSSINELTSLDLQRRSWLDAENTNPHWSFVEFMCCYFDDLAIDEDYKGIFKDDFITSGEYEVIKNWHEQLLKYQSPHGKDYGVEAVLNDDNWKAVVALGLKAKEILAGLLTKTEREILYCEIDHRQYG